MYSMINSTYGVFIIESLSLFDEQKLTDGQILNQILDLFGIPSRYYYLRTAQELEEIIKEFKNSEFRYLHLSCHGDKEQVCLTLDNLFYYELAELVGPYLKSRRLFVSACEVANFNFAKEFIPKHKCFSVIGSPMKIDIPQSAIFWSSFYYLIYEANENKMKQRDLIKVIEKLAQLFKMPINYYSFIKGDYNSLYEFTINPNSKTQKTKHSI